MHSSVQYAMLAFNSQDVNKLWNMHFDCLFVCCIPW